jgi:ATP-binding protein involved in chromosome partitioning
MFQMLEQSTKRSIPILGIVENMSGGIFGTGGGEQAAKQWEIPFLGAIPLEPAITLGGDTGYPAVLGGMGTPQGAAFLTLARQLASRLSVLQFETSPS